MARRTPAYGESTHQTVTVSRGEVEIDEQLAPLILLLWDLGIETKQCCQEWKEDGAPAMIQFRSIDDAEYFLFVARSAGRLCTIEAHAWDGGDLGPQVGLFVRFPITAVPRLVKRFGAHVRRLCR